MKKNADCANGRTDRRRSQACAASWGGRFTLPLDHARAARGSGGLPALVRLNLVGQCLHGLTRKQAIPQGKVVPPAELQRRQDPSDLGRAHVR